MLDHRQVACRVNSKCGSAGDGEFDFWGGKNLYHDQVRDELQCITDSPSLWKSRNSTEYEFSPLLLPYNYQNSNLSPQMRSEAIAQGRRELMEMIHNMPECGYELSLKDIVDEDKTSHAVKEATDDQIHEQKKTTKKKIVEPGGMDNKIFLIKMFFPRSLGSKKKSTSKNCSRVSPRTSFERSENHHEKAQWIEKLSVEGGNETSGKNSSKSNTSSSRKVEANFIPWCWSIFHTKKSKSRGQRGCIF